MRILSLIVFTIISVAFEDLKKRTQNQIGVGYCFTKGNSFSANETREIEISFESTKYKQRSIICKSFLLVNDPTCRFSSIVPQPPGSADKPPTIPQNVPPVVPQPKPFPQTVPPIVPQPPIQTVAPIVPQPPIQTVAPIVPQPPIQTVAPIVPQPPIQTVAPIVPQPPIQTVPPVVPQPKPFPQTVPPVVPQPQTPRTAPPVVPQPRTAPPEVPQPPISRTAPPIVPQPPIPQKKENKTCNNAVHQCQPIRSSLKGDGPFSLCKELDFEEVYFKYSKCVDHICANENMRCNVMNEFANFCQEKLNGTLIQLWASSLNCSFITTSTTTTTEDIINNPWKKAGNKYSF